MRQLSPGAVPSAQAVAVLERLEKAEPRNALALFYLGVAAEAAGNKPAALQRWKTLLALLPADAPIRGMLEERIEAAGGVRAIWNLASTRCSGCAGYASRQFSSQEFRASRTRSPGDVDSRVMDKSL